MGEECLGEAERTEGEETRVERFRAVQGHEVEETGKRLSGTIPYGRTSQGWEGRNGGLVVQDGIVNVYQCLCTC